MRMTYYRYTLIHSVEGSLVLDYAPQEWAEDQFFVERSMTYWGLFRSFSTKELTFIKNGGAFLKNIFETYGTEAVCTFQVEVLNTMTYNYDVQFMGEVDFSTYKLTMNYINGVASYIVKVQIIDDAFTNVVKTREAVDVNLGKLTDLSGNAITPFTHESLPIFVPDKYYIFNANLGRYTSKNTTHAVLLTVVSNDEDSIMDVVDETAYVSKDGAFFNPQYVSTFNANIKATGSAVFTTSGSVSIDLKRYDSGGTLKHTQNIDYHTVTGSGTLNYAIDSDYTISGFNVDDYLILVITVTGGCSTLGILFSVAASYNKLMYSSYSMYGYPYHEAFTRILQAITGTASPFYSSVLGRTDSEIITYPSDGALSLGLVTNGLLIRGFSLTDKDVALNVNMKNLFSSLSAIRPLCLGVETISGVQKVRVEDLIYAFDSHVFLKIDDATNLIEEIANDLTFSALSIGFAKADQSYHGEVGRYEANQTSKYATCLTRQDQELKQVAPYRADNNGISLAREKNIGVAASEDTDYDDSDFLISFVRGTPWQIKRAEGYDSITNVNDSTNTYNVDYSPARSLRNWGSFLRGSLEKYLTSILSFSKSDKNSTMTSKKTAESFTVYEGADIDVADLDEPFYENIYLSFDCVVTNAIIAAVNGYTGGKPNFYGLVGFRNNINEAYQYGWIMKFESRKPDSKGLGTFKLLKCNTDYITPLTQIFNVDKSNIDFLYSDSGSGVTKKVTFTASPDQTITESHIASWITVSINQTTNEVSIYPTANIDVVRNAIVVLSCPNAADINIYVTQTECPQVFTSNKSSLSFTAAAHGSGYAQVITLTISPDQTISETNDLPWATISINQATNTVSVYPTAANTSYERTGTLTLSCYRGTDINVTVTQAAGQIFTSDVSELDFAYNASGSGYQQNANLTIIPDATFSGVTSGLSWATVNYNQVANRVEVYPNSQNTGTDRTGTITLSCSGASDIVLTITQYGSA